MLLMRPKIKSARKKKVTALKSSHVRSLLSRVRSARVLLTSLIAITLAIGAPTMTGTSAGAAGAAPSLGAAANFALLANSAVTCTGATVNGNVGVFPSSGITQTSCPVTGTINPADSVAAQAQNDFGLAYRAFAALPCDTGLAALLTQTLSPGVYCFDVAATSTGGVLTLNGPADGIWIFKVGTLGTGALTGTNFTVVLAGNAQACNVYWHIADAATMTDSDFVGTLLTGAGITQTRGTFHGRALAGAAVTVTGTAVVGCN